MAAIVDKVLANPLLPTQGGERPHLTLTVDLDKLALPPTGGAEDDRWWALTGHPDATDGGEGGDPRTAAERVQAAAATALSGLPAFSWTGPTGLHTAHRLACDSIVTPIITRGSQVLDVGRRTKVVSAALRAFVVARDRHCRWEGCTMPAVWCEAHHVQWWSHGGATTRNNLILLCEHHHHAAHSGRYTLTLNTLTLNTPGHLTIRKRKTTTDPWWEIRTGAGPDDR